MAPGDRPRDPSRDLDLVLLGATGFTGRLTADYLAHHVRDGMRWGIAGRSMGKLERVRDDLVAQVPGLEVELLLADVSDQQTLTGLAHRTRVVASTVGPYLHWGEPLVRACAEAGTDYLDLTGEPEFVDRMWLEHQETAVRTGARLVHACGFDSIPHDLGAWFTVKQLPADEPIVLRGVVRAAGMASGGTFHSAVNAFARARQMRDASLQRRRSEPRPEGRSSRPVVGKPRRDPDLGYWLLPMPTIDPLIVARSGAALDAYGPEFRYSHYAGTRTLRYAAAGGALVGGIGLAAQVKPLRSLLLKRMPQGEGPDASRRERSWFTVEFVGEAGGRTVRTKVSGGDPGYTETAKMLAEASMCLALDENPPTAGQVTTVQAMGDALLERLQKAGIAFEVVAD